MYTGVKAVYLLMLLKSNGPVKLHEEPLWSYYDYFDEVAPLWGELAESDLSLAKQIIEDMRLMNDILDGVHSEAK